MVTNRVPLMLFSADAWPGIADGSITVTFRAWQRPQAKVGGRYRIGGMLIEATDVRQVAAHEITEARRPATAGARGPRHPASPARRRRSGVACRLRVTSVPTIASPGATTRRAEDLAAVIARLARLDRNGAVDPHDVAAHRALSGHRLDDAGRATPTRNERRSSSTCAS